jgi:hypothetical protein
MKAIRPILVALSISCSLTACGAARQNTETLSESIRSYNEGVRWGRFELAASRVPPRERSAFIDEMDQRAKDLKITEYDIVSVDQRGEREAEVHIKMGWYLDSEGTLRETHALQTWARRGKLWLLVEEERLRGDEMPGLPERVRDAEEPEETAQPE